jgi:hypothetical protein
MSEQFENPEAEKLEEKVPPTDAEKKIELIADKAAGRAAKTEQRSDANNPIFTK